MRRAVFAALVLMLSAHGGASQAPTPSQTQAWPSKPVRIAVPVTAGQRDRSGLPHRFRSGIATIGPALHHRQPRRRRRNACPAAVAKADPDGYTLLSHSPALTIFPATHKTLPYDTERDFTGVVALVNTPFLLVVSPEKHKTARELVAAAQSEARCAELRLGRPRRRRAHQRRALPSQRQDRGRRRSRSAAFRKR